MGMSDSALAAAHNAALRFLWNRIDYERATEIPYHTRGFKLERMRELLQRLGNPQDQLRIVHIAGTKGKGSTAAMLAAVLTAAGYRTGLFSSPHLDRVEERLAIDGQSCTAEQLVDLVETLRPVIAAMDEEAARLALPEPGPTYFEITTALGLLHYARSQVHTAVLEVGMGGRLDSTNVVTPEVAVITSISFDHMRQLGNTLTAIAGEKAGIIKPGVPVVSGVTNDEARQVVADISHERGCRLLQLGRDFQFTYQPPARLDLADNKGRLDYYRQVNDGQPAIAELELSLPGRHQAANAAVALATLDVLSELGWTIPEAAVRRGLAGLHWPARVEIVRRQPTVVLDVAHNVASVEALLEVLTSSFLASRRYLIFATSKDKDTPGMLRRLLPAFDRTILTQYHNNPRGETADTLGELAQQVAPDRFETAPDIGSAWARVQQVAQPCDLICVAGSFFLAAEFRTLLRSE